MLSFHSNPWENFIILHPNKIKFHYSRFGVIYSKIIFFCLQLLNGIAQTLLLQMIKMTVLFWKKKRKFCEDGLNFFSFKLIFTQSFQDSLNLVCNCGRAVESTSHFPVYCPSFTSKRQLFSASHQPRDLKSRYFNLAGTFWH